MLFKLSNGYYIVCDTELVYGYNGGFRHRAKLYDPQGYLVDMTTIRYYNRTWESYEYEKVIEKMINKHFKNNSNITIIK